MANGMIFSCGWGIRMLGAMRNDIEYYGTDPNYELYWRLQNLYNDYCDVINKTLIIDIRCSGSECFHPEWENTMGLAFSSPLYFDIEDYKIGIQSYREGTTYQEWVNNYVRPTIKNIYTYLIDGGYFCVNINNTKQHNLFDDWKNIALEQGFKFVCVEDMKNKHRVYGVVNDKSGKVKEYDNDEKILVFQKAV